MSEFTRKRADSMAFYIAMGLERGGSDYPLRQEISNVILAAVREEREWLMGLVCAECGKETGPGGQHQADRDSPCYSDPFWRVVARAEHLRRKEKP